MARPRAATNRTEKEVQDEVSRGYRTAIEQDLVNQAIFLGFISTEEVITVSILLNLLQWLTSMLGKNAVELVLQLQDFTGVDIDIAGLPLETTQRLMNHDA